MGKSKYELRIHVVTQYVDDQSEPDIDRYVFAYTITIENLSNVPAKLLSRHWVITDANGKVEEIEMEAHQRSSPGVSVTNRDSSTSSSKSVVEQRESDRPKCCSCSQRNKIILFN